MTEDRHRERKALETLVAPHRWKVAFTQNEEAAILGRRGVIEFHESTMQTLAAYSTNANVIRLWLTLFWVTPHQRGDKEMRVTFPVSHLEAMAEMIRVKTKRQLPAHLERFRCEPGVQVGKTGQISTIAVGA